jgi:hypothetical protein
MTGNGRTYVRGWQPRPYYGDFVGGIVLGSILAAAGVGIVPYSPDPNLYWYWADPYNVSRLLGLLLLSATRQAAKQIHFGVIGAAALTPPGS